MTEVAWQIPLSAGNIAPNSVQDIVASNKERERLAQQNALKQIFADPNSFNGETGQVSPNAIRQILQSNPQMGIDLQQGQETGALNRKLAEANIQQKNAQVKSFEQEADLARKHENAKNWYFDAQKPTKDYVDDLLEKNPSLSQDQVNDLARAKFKELSDKALKSGNYNLTDKEREAIDGLNYDFKTMTANMERAEASVPELAARNKEIRLEEKDETREKRLNKREDERIRHDIELEKLKNSNLTKQEERAGWEIKEGTDPDTGKPVMFRVNKNTGESAPIEGMNPKSSKQGGMGSRESVFTQRIILSGNEAVKDLENISKLPVTVSTGFFGGRKQGDGLLEAAKESLVNQVTTRDVQLYNVMATGFQRSLSAIESAGLAPSGSLSHQMEAVLLKENDDYLTKASKLAQIRQIIEAGLETALANPRVSDSEKQKIGEVIQKAQKAVPFTQEDVIKLTYSDNPKATLSDFMEKQKPTKKELSGVPTKVSPSVQAGRDVTRQGILIDELSQILKDPNKETKDRNLSAIKKELGVQDLKEVNGNHYVKIKGKFYQVEH